MYIHRLLLPLLLLLIAGCSGMQAKDYAGTEPRLLIEEYFLGHVKAWGIFQSRSGEVRRQFTVDIHGGWEGDEFVLREDFVYFDGETQQRIWRIRKTGEHSYEGSAGDIDGTASGEAYGKALRWRYTLLLEVDGKTWKVNFDDWMFLHEDGILMNRADMSKFGIHLGEVTLFFQRQDNS